MVTIDVLDILRTGKVANYDLKNSEAGQAFLRDLGTEEARASRGMIDLLKFGPVQVATHSHGIYYVEIDNDRGRWPSVTVLGFNELEAPSIESLLDCLAKAGIPAEINAQFSDDNSFRIDFKSNASLFFQENEVERVICTYVDPP